jgi:hypothetical protein
MNHFPLIPLTLVLLLAGGGTARAQETNAAPPANHDPFQALERNNIFDESRVPHEFQPGSNTRRPRVETITFHGTIMDETGGVALLGCSASRDKWLFKTGDLIDGLKLVRFDAESAVLTDPADNAPANSVSDTPANSADSTLTNAATINPTNSTSNGLANPGSNVLTNSSSNKLASSGAGASTNSSSNTPASSGAGTPTNSSSGTPGGSSSHTFVLNLDTHATLRREAGGPWRLTGYIAPEPASGTNAAPAIASATASGAGDNDIIAKLKKKREQEEK